MEQLGNVHEALATKMKDNELFLGTMDYVPILKTNHVLMRSSCHILNWVDVQYNAFEHNKN